MKTIKDMDIDSKKVIIRCDFNVPIKDGKIIDDTRIKASLKTINYCLEHNAKIILLSHLGRVKEEADLQKNDLAKGESGIPKLIAFSILLELRDVSIFSLIFLNLPLTISKHLSS